MIKRFKDKWQKLASGLYVPPFLHLARWYKGSGQCCCEEEQCRACLEDSNPEQVTVTLDGIIADGCANCGNLNDSWVLPLSVECTITPSGYHIVTYSDLFVGSLCADEEFYVTLRVWFRPEISHRIVDSFVTRVPNPADFVYELAEDNSEPFDCVNFDDLDIPFDHHNSGACDASSSTCSVSA